MPTLLTFLSPLLGGKILGVPIATIVAVWPQLQQTVAVIRAVVAALEANGNPEVEAAAKVLAMIAKSHEMTPAEERIWADRASNVGLDGA
jgi:hypothetical protein